jgi:hypothetical protein
MQAATFATVLDMSDFPQHAMRTRSGSGRTIASDLTLAYGARDDMQCQPSST